MILRVIAVALGLLLWLVCSIAYWEHFAGTVVFQ